MKPKRRQKSEGKTEANEGKKRRREKGISSGRQGRATAFSQAGARRVLSGSFPGPFRSSPVLSGTSLFRAEGGDVDLPQRFPGRKGEGRGGVRRDGGLYRYSIDVYRHRSAVYIVVGQRCASLLRDNPLGPPNLLDRSINSFHELQ